jgi:flagellar biosynthesis component FlhA
VTSTSFPCQFSPTWKAAIQVLISLLPTVASIAVIVLVVAVEIYTYYQAHKSQVDNCIAQSKNKEEKEKIKLEKKIGSQDQTPNHQKNIPKAKTIENINR